MMDSSSVVDKQHPNTIVAMIALESPRLGSANELLQELHRLDPFAMLGDPNERAGSIFAFYNGNMGIVSLMPTAMPWHHLEGPCATAWWWPQAADEMRRHTHHLLVALAGKEGDTLSRALTATRIAGAATILSDSIGVYWGAGRIVHQAEEFVRQTREASTDRAPVHLWIDMRLEQAGDASVRFYTTGLSLFNKKEFEIECRHRPAQEIFDFMYDVIHYVITQNVTIRDGETIGRSAGHEVAVVERPSFIDPEQMVLRVEY